VAELPEGIMRIVDSRTEPDSKERRDLINLLKRLLSGERVYLSEVRGKSVYYHVSKLRKEGILLLVRGPGRKSYLMISPEALKNP